MSKATLCNAIEALIPNEIFIISVIDGKEVVKYENPNIAPTEEQIQAKLAELEAAEPLRLLRLERDQLLSQSDWRDLPSYPGSNQEAWRTYRQQLRDLPSTTDPSNPTWPTAPEND
tara:strand:+ start:2875 stop:3222 length:348 start_codon:yes stop_codon:yes gene_type:complete